MEGNDLIMSPTTSESDDDMLSKEDQVDSPSFDEGSCEGSLGGGSGLKKGPWTSAEDAILVDYVRKHGEGNWNAVQKHSGLYRCGKSCRLRWANHLRPNLKKGAFTSEEEHLIIELHAKLGNKWARMAAHLPGRTDNEIKNYWNTRIKRRQRAGLPLYPPDVCLQQVLNENQQVRNTNEFNSGDTPHHIMQASNYDIPDVIFDHLKSHQGLLAYAPPLPDLSIGSTLNQSLGSSQNYSFMPSTMHRPKRLRGSEILYPGFNSSVTNGFMPVDQFQIDATGKINQPFGLSFPYDPDPNGKNPSAFGVLPGSHALLNGNFSASKAISGSLKLELPSLQYPEMELGSWGMSSPQPPSLDSVDAFIQSPPSTRPVPDCLSPRNSGLLDALLHESQALSGTKNQSSEKSSSSCVVTPGDIVDSSTLNCETEWEEYGDPISPLCRSAASVFNESTPVSGNSLDEPPAPRGLFGFGIKTEPVDHDTSPDEKKQIPTGSITRPDALLDAAWSEQSYECAKDQSILTDAISTLIGEDICGDYKSKFTESSSLSQGWGSSFWNSLPAVCQMSQLR